MPLDGSNEVQRGRFYLKLVGAVFIIFTLASVALLLSAALDWVQLDYTLAQKIAASIEVPLMVVLGVWCLSGSKKSWYVSQGYLIVSLIYHESFIVITHGVWSGERQLQLALLALFYGGLIRAFSAKSILAYLGLNNRPIVVEIVILISIGVGCFLILSYFFNTLVGLFALAALLGPWVYNLIRKQTKPGSEHRFS